MVFNFLLSNQGSLESQFNGGRSKSAIENSGDFFVKTSGRS